MATKHLIDPELLPLLDVFPKFEFPQVPLPLIRQHLATMIAALPPPPENGVTVVERFIPGPKGSPGAPDVRVLIYTPSGKAAMRPALLHIHGGGYVVGTPEMSHYRNHLAAADLACVIVSVDYRLPPEHPHPAPVEDCYSALKWLHGHAAELGVNPHKIAIGGESAGGGLTAALALLARDRKEVSVAFQLLIYPMLDDRTCTTARPNPNTGEFVWTAEDNRFGWTSLLGKAPGSDDVSCYASAAHTTSVAGLPPTFIAVGALDLFLEEDIAYAQRLLRAGVATELHVYPGAFHGFDIFTEARVSKQFIRDYREALRNAFNAI